MSSDDKKEEISPEERLLRVIQQGKGAAVQSPPSPSGTTAPPAASSSAAKEGVPPTPPAKLKLAEKQGGEKESPPVSTPAAVPVAPIPVSMDKKAEAAVEETAVSTAATVAAPAAFLIDKAEGGSTTRGLQGLILANRILLGIVCMALILVVLDFVMARPVSLAPPDVSGAGAASAQAMPAPMLLEPLDNFTRKIGSRNVFFAAATAPASSNNEGAAPVRVSENARNLKLMGVSIDSVSADESMVILADSKGGKTYFVKVGQRIGETDMAVAKVFADHVIIKNKKEEIELR